MIYAKNHSLLNTLLFASEIITIRSSFCYNMAPSFDNLTFYSVAASPSCSNGVHYKRARRSKLCAALACDWDKLLVNKSNNINKKTVQPPITFNNYLINKYFGNLMCISFC